MQDERKRILQLVENGTISAQEAITLLEKLDQKGTKSAEVPKKEEVKQSTHQQEQLKEEQTYKHTQEDEKSKKEDEFINDIKRDFNEFGTKFMDFIGAAVNKVRDIDFSSMTSGNNKFSWIEPIENTLFDNISVDMPNGQLTIRDSVDGSAYLEVSATPLFRVGAQKDLSNEEIKKQFNCGNDAGTLRIHNTAKMLKTDVIMYVPKGDYRRIRANLFNGGFTLHSINADQVNVETKNGSIHISDITFDSVDVESANGSIDIRDVAGREVEAETMNGRVYIDGSLRSIEAKSLNGHVVVTSKSQQTERIKANTAAGTIELYVPESVSLIGELSSTFGKMDVVLGDVEFLREDNQMFNKSVRFRKVVPDAHQLTIDGETQTGSVIVRYTV
ncbi:DUF4097 family beta strand repeat-containing protein [Kurthia gibsonii]|uniref:DUF4097 family beta strand repeat-containing protein n=1 Tax=Kurthia gibsonii TaxID=33946 RepID=UPI0030CC33F4